MSLDRRQFVVLGAAVALAVNERVRPARGAGTAPPATAPASTPATHIVDAGPLSAYTRLGVYDQFRERGFFILRRRRMLFVISSVCTHKGCKVRSQGDGSFLCRCHGSRFDAEGRVLNPPATRALPRLAVDLTPQDHVLVNLAMQFPTP